MTTAINIDDFFEHHGVKGMRWGHTMQKVGANATKKAALKSAQDEARQEIGRNFRARYDVSKKAGSGGTRAKNAARGLALVPDILTTGGMYTGSQMARAAGYTKGQSAAIGIAGGPLGGLIASEIRVNQRAKAKLGTS